MGCETKEKIVCMDKYISFENHERLQNPLNVGSVTFFGFFFFVVLSDFC